MYAMSAEQRWQTYCGALLVLWLFTLAFFTFRGAVIEGQYFIALRGDLLAAVQQLAQQQQSLAQRLQALEGK
jgi:hypothetical protein